MMKKLLVSVFAALLIAAPIQANEVHAAATQPAPLKIVASFSILADMAQQVGGDAVEVHALVEPEQDAHIYQPTAEDAKALAQADIIAINGLHFEGWIGRLIKASGTKAKLLVASAGVKPRILEAAHDDHGHEHEAEHQDAHEKSEPTMDPHAWQDLRNGQLYAKNIASAVIAARPDRAEEIKTRARAYIAELGALDVKTREAFAALSKDKRKIITNHDAFGYFAAAYGVTFIAPLGISTEAEPSAAAIAALTKQIKQENVRALFLENGTDPRLIEQIAKDTGSKVGGTLYADTLSKPNGDAPTYLDMMKANSDTLLAAIR